MTDKDATSRTTPARDRQTTSPAGNATSSNGGYGVGSDRSSGGSGDTPPPDADENRTTTADDETQWLRKAPGGNDDPAEGARPGSKSLAPATGPAGSDDPVEGPRT
jgi:hypothetical protein